jgi:hypothetical protein
VHDDRGPRVVLIVGESLLWSLDDKSLSDHNRLD